MRIQLPDLGFKDRPYRFYAGDRPRHARASAVALTSPSTLVCCDLEGCRLYACSFDLLSGKSEIVRGVTTTTASGEPRGIDTFDYQGDVIFAACCGGPITVYDADTLRSLRDVPAHGMIHSVRRLPCGGRYALCYVDERRVDVVDGDMKVTSSVSGGGWNRETRRPRWRAKDACFVGDTCYVLWNGSDIESEPGHPTSARITVHALRPDGILQPEFAELALPFHADVLCLDQYGRLLVNGQDTDTVYVIERGGLREVRRIEGFYMPHGIHQEQGLLAVACYGDNTVRVQNYP